MGPVAYVYIIAVLEQVAVNLQHICQGAPHWPC